MDIFRVHDILMHRFSCKLFSFPLGYSPSPGERGRLNLFFFCGFLLVCMHMYVARLDIFLYLTFFLFYFLCMGRVWMGSDGL